jgi:hypothetical protein
MSDVPTNEVVTPAKRTIKVKKSATTKATEKPEKPKKPVKAAVPDGDCAICMEKFNRNTHTRVECQHCHQPTCRTCLQTYLLDAGMVPMCMMPECKMPWSEDFVETNTLTTWRLSSLKKAREQFIYDIQRSRLPETQEAAEDYLAAKKFIERYQKEVVEPAAKELEKFPAHKGLQEVEAEIDALDMDFKNKQLGFHTFLGCEKYEEYMAWCKKKQELVDKEQKFHAQLNGMAIDPKVVEAEKRMLENKAKHKAALKKVNRVWKGLLKGVPTGETLNQLTALKNADYKAAFEEHEKLLDLIRADQNFIFHNSGNPYRRAVKEYNRIKAGNGRLVLDNVIVLDGHDLWRARRCVDSMGAQPFRGSTEKREVAEKRAFVRACPAGDCRGFLSTAWKCGLCNVWVCPDCHDIKKEQKDDSHVCNKDALETAKLLAKEAKPCPKCAAQISKIDGCDQMWCTQCHTSFSWRTGQEVKDGEWIHNPHYYEWMRRNGKAIPRTPGDPGRAGVDPCGGFIQWQTLAVLDPMALRDRRRTAYGNARAFGYGTDYGVSGMLREAQQPDLADERRNVIVHEMAWRILECFHQHAADMRWRYQRRPDILTNDDIYKTLRVQFLAGEMNEEELKVMLQRKEKARRKTKADWDIHNMYVTAANDLFQMLASHSMDVFQVINALEDLRVYTNEMLATNEKRFNNRFRLIAEPGHYMEPAVKLWYAAYKENVTAAKVKDTELGYGGVAHPMLVDLAVAALKKVIVPMSQ